jgi:hypothetical protein
MTTKFERFFVNSAAVLLLLVAISKIVSANGDARVLSNLDPIFSVSFRSFFYFAGTIELFIAFFCLFGHRTVWKVGILALLSTIFLIYRLGLMWIGYSKPCPCLGNLMGALHIQPETAETVVKIILTYLLIGSYGSLFWLWRQRKRAAALAGI